MKVAWYQFYILKLQRNDFAVESIVVNFNLFRDSLKVHRVLFLYLNKLISKGYKTLFHFYIITISSSLNSIFFTSRENFLSYSQIYRVFISHIEWLLNNNTLISDFQTHFLVVLLITSIDFQKFSLYLCRNMYNAISVNQPSPDNWIYQSS
jgi:hypothetical protein